MGLLKINSLSLCAVSRKDFVTCRFQMKCDEICERTQHSGGEKNIYIYMSGEGKRKS
jgi:hypothetical protein